MPASSQSIDKFLATLSSDKREALETLRKIIRAAVPGSEECISYGVPAIRLDGKLIVAFGAGENHCALYPGPFAIETHKNELKAYSISKGTIRFTADRPMPAALVRKLIKTRITQHSKPKSAASKGKSRGKPET